MTLEKIFKVFPTISLWELRRPLRCGQYGPQGYGWKDLCRGQLDIAKY